jgi:hypothetical protein
MSIKLLFVLGFVVILVSLASALYNLVKHKGEAESQKTFKALMLRIGLSLVLFICLFIALATGLIKPEGIGSRIAAARQASTPVNQ